MLVTNHVAAGAAIGALLHRRPALAFAAGVASHVAMDCLPHWGLPREPESHDRFLEVAKKDGLAGLAAIAVLSGPAPFRSNRTSPPNDMLVTLHRGCDSVGAEQGSARPAEKGSTPCS